MKLIKWFKSLKLSTQIILSLSLLLTGALTISSIVAYNVCYSLVVGGFKERATKIIVNDPLNDFFMQEPAPNSDFQNHMLEKVLQELNTTLLSYFIISTLLIVALSVMIALLVIKRPLDKMKDGFNKMESFVSDASHELKTPLAIINGYAQLYKMKGSEITKEETDEAIEKIEENSQRMNDLVTDLLVLTRIDQNQKTATQQIDLLKITEELVKQYKLIDNNRKVTIRTSLNSAMTNANESQIWRVFLNFMQNIDRYTPHDTPVEIELSKAGSKIKVDFIDHGPGIATTDIDKIFDRFWTKDVSRARKSSGTGLGMSISKAIVESFGGTINCYHTRGGGLTVSCLFTNS